MMSMRQRFDLPSIHHPLSIRLSVSESLTRIIEHVSSEFICRHSTTPFTIFPLRWRSNFITFILKDKTIASIHNTTMIPPPSHQQRYHPRHPASPHSVTRIVQFLSTVHSETSSVRGLRDLPRVAMTPSFFPLTLVLTMTASGLIGFYGMNYIQQKRWEVRIVCKESFMTLCVWMYLKAVF